MALKMKGLLQSDYDVQSYADYIAGKRKYFTIEGMTIEKNPSAPTLHEDPVPFLRTKYTSASFVVSTKVAKDYIKTYEMEGGIITNTTGNSYETGIQGRRDGQTQMLRIGKLSYIKDTFLFAAYIWTLTDFEKIEDDPEKVFTDSFKLVGMWNYDICHLYPAVKIEHQLYVACEHHSCEIKKLKSDIMRLDAENESAADDVKTITKKLFDSVHDIDDKQSWNKVEIKKLQDQLVQLTMQHECTKQISKNLEEMIVGACSSLSSAIDKNEKSNNECFEQLYKCIDKIGKHEQYCQEMEDEFAYLLRDQRDDFNKEIRGLELFTSTFLIIVTFIVGTAIAFSIANYVSLRNYQQPEQSSALVCL